MCSCIHSSFLFEPWKIRSLFLSHVFFSWIHFIEGTTQVFVYLGHGAVVVELVAVVWSTEYRYKLLVCEEFIAILHYLVAAHYQIEAVLAQELADHLLAEDV